MHRAHAHCLNTWQACKAFKQHACGRFIGILKRKYVGADRALHHVQPDFLDLNDDFTKPTAHNFGIAFRGQDPEHREVACDQVGVSNRGGEYRAELVEAAHRIGRAKGAAKNLRVLESDPEQAEARIRRVGTLISQPVENYHKPFKGSVVYVHDCVRLTETAVARLPFVD